MRVVAIRYSTGAKLKDDVQRAFPNWDGDKQDIPEWLDNHCFAKGRVRDENDVVLGFDIYLLVRDDFRIPVWIQGIEIPREQHQHTFLGY